MRATTIGPDTLFVSGAPALLAHLTVRLIVVVRMTTVSLI
jgi:hypothetical protein